MLFHFMTQTGLTPATGVLLGIAFLAPVAALVQRWSWRKPLPSLRGKHVLLVEGRNHHRAHLRSLLEQEGCDILASADVTEAFSMLHSSAYPLVVVIDTRHLKLLERALPDIRMGAHHVYVVVIPWNYPSLSAMRHLRMQLTLRVVVGRRRWRAIVRAIARASGTLPSDPLYPPPPSEQISPSA